MRKNRSNNKSPLPNSNKESSIANKSQPRQDSKKISKMPGDLTDEQIEEKYAKGEVRIVTEQARYPLNTIKGLVESSDYELNHQSDSFPLKLSVELGYHP